MLPDVSGLKQLKVESEKCKTKTQNVKLLRPLGRPRVCRRQKRCFFRSKMRKSSHKMAKKVQNRRAY